MSIEIDLHTIPDLQHITVDDHIVLAPIRHTSVFDSS